MMMKPMIIDCQYVDTFSMTSALRITHMMPAPMIVPDTLPSPPAIDAPPMTHDAMASI